MDEKRATLCFTPALSKRLIAKGVAALPQVRKAFEKGRILLSSGSTTAHIYVELTGSWSGEPLACGMLSHKGMCVGQAMSEFLGRKGHARFWLFEKGRRVETEDLEASLESLGAGDVLIKGANAIDSNGRVGVLLGMENGGFLGKSLAYVMARGIELVLPGGLEKAVFGSIDDVAREMGTRRVDYTTGMPVGMLPVAGTRMCEIDALGLLAGVKVFHAASGGSAGAEGSVVLVVKGEPEQVESVVELYRRLRVDDRFEALKVEPSRCGEHKWPPCASHNFLYTENVKKGI